MMQIAFDFPRLRYDWDSDAAHVGHLPHNWVLWKGEEQEENAHIYGYHDIANWPLSSEVPQDGEEFHVNSYKSHRHKKGK